MLFFFCISKNACFKVHFFLSYFLFIKMDSIQKILEDSRIQAFWKYHASRLNYQKEISKLNMELMNLKNKLHDLENNIGIRNLDEETTPPHY